MHNNEQETEKSPYLQSVSYMFIAPQSFSSGSWVLLSPQ